MRYERTSKLHMGSSYLPMMYRTASASFPNTFGSSTWEAALRMASMQIKATD